MTVSTTYPSASLTGTVPTAATSLAGATPLSPYGTTLPTNTASMPALNGAQAATGAATSPEASAMASAIAELRAQGVPEASINQQVLAMQAESGVGATPSASAALAAPKAVATAHKSTVAAKKQVTVAKKPMTAAAKAKAAKAAKVKAAAAKAKAANAAKLAATTTPATMGATGAVPAGSTLPANATQLPGGTVYSYADPNNAGLAGLQGLTPQQQLALGVMPNGLANGLSGQSTPQANITNQSNVDPGSLLGISGLGGLAGYGGVPTVGAPILGNSNVSAPAAGTTTTPTTSTSAPKSQTVSNKNANDNGSYSQGVDPYGSLYGGYGVGGYGGLGGVGTYGGYGNTGIAGGLYSPYGASMTGAALSGTSNGGGIMGWLGRLFT